MHINFTESKLTLIEQQMQIWRIPLTMEQMHSFHVMYSEIVRFSVAFGLTTAKESLEEKHFLDSLLAVPYLKSINWRSVLDIGSGAGFPGLCLAVVFPECRFTLCERNTKKAGFLLSTAHLMNLKNVTIFPGDYEQEPNTYDGCVFRALAKVNPVVARKFLKKAPCILAYKGKLVETNKEKMALLEAKIPTYVHLLKEKPCGQERTLLWFTQKEEELVSIVSVVEREKAKKNGK